MSDETMIERALQTFSRPIVGMKEKEQLLNPYHSVSASLMGNDQLVVEKVLDLILPQSADPSVFRKVHFRERF